MVEGVKIIINVHTGKVMIFSVSIEVYDAISTGGTITNKNEYDIKTFFRSISSQAYVEEDVDRSC